MLLRRTATLVLALALFLPFSGCKTAPKDPAERPRFGYVAVTLPGHPDSRSPASVLCEISPRVFVVESMTAEYIKHACGAPPPADTEAGPFGIEISMSPTMRGQCGPQLPEGLDLSCIYQAELDRSAAREGGDCLTFVCRARFRYSERGDSEVLQSKRCTSNSDPVYDSTRCNFGR